MPIVIGPALRAAPFRLRGLVLFFFMAGLLLHFECAFHWELIASRRGSALSFHLCAVRVSSGTEPGASATGLTDGLRPGRGLWFLASTNPRPTASIFYSAAVPV